MQRNILKRVLWISVACLLVFAVVKGVLFWNKLSARMHNGKVIMARDFQKALSQIGKEDYLSADQKILIKELELLISDKEISFFGLALTGTVGRGILEDGQFTQEEDKALALVIEFLREENGKVGFFEAVTFVGTHPELRKVIDKRLKQEEPEIE